MRDPIKISSHPGYLGNSSHEEKHAGFDGGDGGGTIDPMEARVAKLEAAVTHIERDVADLRADMRLLRSDQRSDFRLTWGAVIAAALGLAGLMAKGFHWF